MTLAGLVSQIISIINLVVALLGSVALAIFIYGGVRYIFKADDSRKQAEKEFLGWSLLVLFVIVSVFGILQVIQGIFVT